MMGIFMAVPIVAAVVTAGIVRNMIENYKQAMGQLNGCHCSDPFDRPEVIQHTSTVCAPKSEITVEPDQRKK